MKNGQLLLGVALILVLFYFILQEQRSVNPPPPPQEIVVVRRPGGVGAPFGYRVPPFRRRRFGPRRRRWMW